MKNKITDIRLISQQLSGTTLQTAKEIVSWMGAMQAQDFNMAKWAVAMRLPGYTEAMVDAAFNSGSILRTHVLRPTWHLVAPENIRWMLSLSADKIKLSTKSRDRDLEISEELYCKTNRVIEKVLEGKHLTRAALREEFERAKITIDTPRLSHFMMRAELDGIVCSGALQGKTQTYALLNERVPCTKPLSREEALVALVQHYFTSHCPATLQDFVWWSGLSQTEAKQGLETVKSAFISETVNGQTYWMTDTSCNIAKVNKSIYLLPAFDEYIISYRDRQAAILPENHSKAISSNGIFKPTIVANGQVVGLWKKSNTKQELLFDFFKQPDISVKNKADEAAMTFLSYKS
ncbi:MAG: winged helix DNA-binding domain-containing protein [Prevotellaceae bacterium]|jgi:hypothetical protein|nr:winged helix DNA-binding domain-containing protein [Prevotellaceae bacterium]